MCAARKRFSDPGIHLISATVTLLIILPRLALALLATLAEWRHALGAALPASVVPYFRSVFGETASTVLGRGIAAVIPYAYEPPHEAIVALRSLLPAVLGEGTAVDLREGVRYGDEEVFLARLAEREAGVADNLVLLFTLAATPDKIGEAMALALRAGGN